ncbi:MAG: DNA-binding response regulator [Chloroflexi bacterium]|nr:MAG: DNA-binding response regulator [Chloroflexota bacterium]
MSVEVITVLLAEDHAVVREATAEVVNHQPDMCVVGQAGTGEEAVTVARDTRPDVVVMDVAMPRLDGVEATRQIVAACPATRVLVLTAHEEDECILRSLHAGAVGFLPKAVDLDVLLNAIRAAARGESVLPPTVAAVVVRHLTGKGEVEAPPDAARPLTDRELEVLRLAAEGLTNYDIGQRLCISVHTVEAHLTHVYNKLGVGSRIEAVVHAIRHGWVQLENSNGY